MSLRNEPHSWKWCNQEKQHDIQETSMLFALISLAGFITAGLVATACINVLLQLEDIDHSP